MDNFTGTFATSTVSASLLMVSVYSALFDLFIAVMPFGLGIFIFYFAYSSMRRFLSGSISTDDVEDDESVDLADSWVLPTKEKNIIKRY